MDQIEVNLNKYLAIECILNELFKEINYCLDCCIAKPGAFNFPNAGCCRNIYYTGYDIEHPAFDRLVSQREALYGKPSRRKWLKRISPCEYHSLSGCILKTHKSPVCLSFFCRDGIDFLRDRYHIYVYDYLGIHYALEWILTGDLIEAAFEDFKKSCVEMVQKVKR